MLGHADSQAESQTLWSFMGFSEDNLSQESRSAFAEIEVRP